LKMGFHEMLLSFFRGLDRRFKVMLVAIGFYSWTSRLPSQYNQLYATALGANPVELGSLNSLGGLVNSLISAPLGWLIDKYGVKKLIILGLALSAAVSGIYGCAVNWWMLIPAIILTQISMRMIMPLTDIIIVETTKSKERSLAMGFSRTIWAIPSIFAPMTAAIIVLYFGGINAQGIRPLYFMQLATIVFIILFVTFMLKPLPTQFSAKKSKPKRDPEKISLIEDFKELLKSERWLKHWAAIMSLRQFGMSIAMPFIPLWMVQMKGADPYILGTLGTLSVVTSALLQIPMGRLADKIGRKKVFLMLRPFSYLGNILLIYAPNPEALIIVGILGTTGLMGGIDGVSFIPFITMYWESVSAEKRGRLFGFTGIFSIFSVFASILGGFMWQAGYAELVLILPVLIEIVIVMPVLLRIPDKFITQSS